jgi:hypothetical protein
LDALTKSGMLPLEEAALHVVIASTHCFERSLLSTVLQYMSIYLSLFCFSLSLSLSLSLALWLSLRPLRLLAQVIMDNVNPIEKLERSSLIVASTLHRLPAVAMVNESHCERIRQYNPLLLEHIRAAGS